MNLSFPYDPLPNLLLFLGHVEGTFSSKRERDRENKKKTKRKLRNRHLELGIFVPSGVVSICSFYAAEQPFPLLEEQSSHSFVLYFKLSLTGPFIRSLVE